MLQGSLFGVRYFPKGIFQKGDFPSDNLPVATSQMCNFLNGNFPKVRLGLLRRRRLHRGRALRLGWDSGPSDAARTG